MKNNGSLILSAALLLTLATLTGCTSPGANPAGVYDSSGSIPLANRWTGGSEHVGMFEPVLFAYDSSQVSSGQRAKVEAVGSHLKANQNVAVIIEGHSDERGSREYNLALGERRALAVRTYMIGLGISSDRIQTKSFGEERPAVQGHDAASYSQNRRGEFVLYY